MILHFSFSANSIILVQDGEKGKMKGKKHREHRGKRITKSAQTRQRNLLIKLQTAEHNTRHLSYFSFLYSVLKNLHQASKFRSSARYFVTAVVSQ